VRAPVFHSPPVPAYDILILNQLVAWLSNMRDRANTTISQTVREREQAERERQTDGGRQRERLRFRKKGESKHKGKQRSKTEYSFRKYLAL
jgi:hypothetical protein